VGWIDVGGKGGNRLTDSNIRTIAEKGRGTGGNAPGQVFLGKAQRVLAAEMNLKKGRAATEYVRRVVGLTKTYFLRE